ncbi:MAG TPA: hypothetical protein EYG50_03210 [Cycloclasticus sp.]|jgi:hypothetical protein|nr:hypothetical protein [Cycloclasticus sp.]HIL91748.1 hypothetical protein [Cycloclasticus sp.]
MSIRNLSTEELKTLFPIRNFPDSSKTKLQNTVQTEDISANKLFFQPAKAMIAKCIFWKEK